MLIKTKISRIRLALVTMILFANLFVSVIMFRNKEEELFLIKKIQDWLIYFLYNLLAKLIDNCVENLLEYQLKFTGGSPQKY